MSGDENGHANGHPNGHATTSTTKSQDKGDENGAADATAASSGVAVPAVASAAPPDRPDRLSELPKEILLRIFDRVGRACKRDLCAVSRLNKHLHALADLVLYKDMIFYDPGHHMIFCESLDRRPRRGSLIENLTLTYGDVDASDEEDDPAHHVHVTHALSAMSNLTTLDVAVPGSLAPVFGTLFNGPFDLPSLTHCTLEYQCPGSAYWDLQDNIHMFSHPTVTTLILRRARLRDQGFRDHMEKPHMTPLRVLHFLECDINDDGLADLLEYPAALEEFVMVHAAEPEVALEESADNVGYYATALEAQRESLKSVTIDMAMLTGRRALRMREFGKVETLRLSWDYQLFGRTSKKPRLHSVGLPPEMRTLEFFQPLGEDEEVTDLLEHTILNKAVLAEKWERLIVPEGDDMMVLRQIRRACREAGLEFTVIGDDDDEEEEEE